MEKVSELFYGCVQRTTDLMNAMHLTIHHSTIMQSQNGFKRCNCSKCQYYLKTSETRNKNNLFRNLYFD